MLTVTYIGAGWSDGLITCRNCSLVLCGRLTSVARAGGDNLCTLLLPDQVAMEGDR